MPVELPFDDEEASTSVDFKTQMIRFIATGAGSAVLDLGLTMFLQDVVGWPFAWSKAFGFILGTTVAYLINRRWTFRAEPSKARFIAVVLLYGVTFFVNVGLYAWLMHVGMNMLPDDPSKLGKLACTVIAFGIAQGVATVINFVVQRAVIFKIR
ncbi:MAG: GtrA family protein [Gordonia sp. (in: high G+C Gram-positive bacteria)]|uniref:GtrA family protein n=1 Tax=Gordonia sp. (in: high G+C Gram-positive bacteria) TaxID=84139 RepID=UPI0039E5A8A7